MSVSFLKRKGAPDLAYLVIPAQSPNLPTVVFFPGFRSDMQGTKAAYLAETCAKRGQGCVLFDYSGHGQSGGVFEEGSIDVWFSDALAIIDAVATGPLVFVGSSMGGWIGLLASMARKDRAKGFIGLAAAPDFTRALLSQADDAQRAQLVDEGYFMLPSQHNETPYTVTQKFIDDGEKHCLLDREIPIEAPVRLVQGMKDQDVSWQTAHRILNRIQTADKKVYLREDGGHRLSDPADLALLGQLVEELSGIG